MAIRGHLAQMARYALLAGSHPGRVPGSGVGSSEFVIVVGLGLQHLQHALVG